MNEIDLINFLAKESENNKEYDAETIESINKMKQALEKQVPEKVNRIVKSEIENGGFYVYCPCCNDHLESLWTGKKYCPDCGQRLEWEE